ESIQRLGLENTVRLRCKDLAAVTRPTHRDLPRGIVVVNPPWGERMGSLDSLPPLYNRLGRLMSYEFTGWQGVVLTSKLDLGKAIGLRAIKKHRFHNGRLELHCLQFDLSVDNKFRSLAQYALRQPSEPADVELPTLTEGAAMVMNRLRKNYRRLKPWIERECISNYRLYDADIPEYAAAIDIYEGHLHIAEYAAPKSIPEETARRRLHDVVLAAQHYAGLPSADSIAIKRRSRQRGAGQYQKLGASADRLVVREGRIKALVNLHDYVDTGLFLDHRPLRSWIAREAKGRHFLNLFSYTGVATLHAAAGGATTSTSVDASTTYLDWFKANLALNGFSERQHRGLRSDVRIWLATDTSHYDLIMLDPPSFSNSKGARDFDVQADHESLLELAMARLSGEGVLYFSTNRRRFELSESVTARWCVENVTAPSIPEDFSRHQRIHACWRLKHLRPDAEKARVVIFGAILRAFFSAAEGLFSGKSVHGTNPLRQIVGCASRRTA
ncbi:MAG: bifunctional 23S rRNA (guanine(2069)-N(7))-methyltransferase RlmK/23S rRNA (guanine(2445)-N(2))-methyltransferase RlmL, partial [Pseudomonadota bacterium]|nr:bifunctional 23S rRNA (guanine(2069)-N(7))-methyltransferase RlmK/23S rRNA (guanine(2445)-N(2))-methyltransferase RlmL [Pseudomonadota bacterium]